MKRISIALVAVALAACATQPQWRWAKDGETPGERERTYAQCDYEATAATASMGTGGYRTMVGSSLEMTLRQVELIKMCMAAKGWRQQAL